MLYIESKKSEKIDLLEATFGPSENRIVVVYQRVALFVLRFKFVKVLPGYRERKQD